MKDGIIKENGASRLVKGSLPATYDEFKALAASAGVPVDVLFNAAGWQQLPTFLNKANLLQDFTATLLGLDPADDPTVDDAFLNVFLTSANAGLLKIRVYETGTQTPIGGVRITGVTDMLGGDLYADDNGLAVGMAVAETSTIQVDTSYIDLTGQTIFSGATPVREITEITLYATRIPSGTVIQIDSSKSIMVSGGQDNLATRDVPVHLIGGGQGGGVGYCSVDSETSKIDALYTGLGGRRGKSYVSTIQIETNKPYPVVVGAGGNGASGFSGSSPTKAVSGLEGGNTTFAGISSDSGSTVSNVGTKGWSSRYGKEEPVAPVDSIIYPFNDSSESPIAGGQGGISVSRTYGGQSTSQISGSLQFGGNGAGYSSAGGAGRGPGAGGASGGITTNTNWTSATAKNGGRGGDGLFLIKV